jgi:hypothetical protein
VTFVDAFPLNFGKVATKMNTMFYSAFAYNKKQFTIDWSGLTATATGATFTNMFANFESGAGADGVNRITMKVGSSAIETTFKENAKTKWITGKPIITT